MLRKTKIWDVRCPRELVQLFPIRRGYWYKVDRGKARLICEALAKAYEVYPPIVDERTPSGAYGWFCSLPQPTISIWKRAHIKTVFHEFYHHLDYVTGGRYDSSDRRGGSTSLSWIFADKLFDQLRQS